MKKILEEECPDEARFRFHGVSLWPTVEAIPEEDEKEEKEEDEDMDIECLELDEETISRPIYRVKEAWPSTESLPPIRHHVKIAWPSVETLTTTKWWIPKCLRRNTQVIYWPHLCNARILYIDSVTRPDLRSRKSQSTGSRRPSRLIRSIFCCCSVKTLE